MTARIVKITAAQLRPGDQLRSLFPLETVAAVSHGPNVGFWLRGNDMRWLIAEGTELTVVRA